jgi:hypothetical protein
MLNRQIAKLLELDQVNYKSTLDVNNDPYLIRVLDQTNENSLNAVRQNGMVLQFIEVQSPEICLAAVTEHGYALQFVKEQTEEIVLAAIKSNAFAVKFMNPKLDTPEFRAKAIEVNPTCIRMLGENTEQSWLDAIANDPRFFLDVPDFVRTTDFTTKAVQINPDVIVYVKDQTLALCRMAVAKDPYLWQYCTFQPMDFIETVYDVYPKLVVDHTYHHTDDYYIAICRDQPKYAAFLTQSPIMQRRAIERNRECLIFMSGVDPYVMAEIIRNDANCLKYVQEQTHELQTIAVENDPTAIRYCINPSLELCRKAAKMNPHGIHLIPEKSIENLLFQPLSQTNDDLPNKIDKSTCDKIPDTNTLNSLFMEIIQSGRSVEDKAALLKKLLNY